LGEVCVLAYSDTFKDTPKANAIVSRGVLIRGATFPLPGKFPAEKMTAEIVDKIKRGERLVVKGRCDYETRGRIAETTFAVFYNAEFETFGYWVNGNNAT
jgi:hypothetical protein